MAILGTAALLAACHSNNDNSGYGIVWVTVTDDPADFTSYVTSIASLTMTRNDGQVFTAIATEEPVDFATLGTTSEMWASASIPNGTYTSATITLDYTSASAYILNGGAPTLASLVGTTGAAVTASPTISVTVNFDPANQPVIVPTYASTSAVRLAIDFNVAASNSVNLGTSPPTVTVNPFMTIGVSPADTKPIRVRGPLINSNANLGTYTVYVRPFHDEANALGTLTLFNSANTVYTIDGATYQGATGLNQLTQAPAGTTMTAAYTTFEPTPTPTATAGKFNTIYVVGGSSLETSYTSRLSGDVIQRTGNTVTLRGATLSLPDGTFSYNLADCIVELSSSTEVTEDGQVTLTPLNAGAIAVGQRIYAVGNYQLLNNVVTLDATSGKVRLLPTELYGTLLSTTTGGLSLELLNIDNWPVGDYVFAGNGQTTAQDSSPANYQVNTGALALPTGAAAGSPLWIDGLTNAFGAAPPDFNATAVTAEASEPASLQAHWAAGTTAPFAGLSNTGFSIDLTNANLTSAVIRIGPESIALSTLPASPAVVPTATPMSNTFSPLFAVGNAANGISVYSSFASFVSKLDTTFAANTQAIQFEARGLYNRNTNTFTANSVNVVL